MKTPGYLKGITDSHNQMKCGMKRDDHQVHSNEMLDYEFGT